MTDGPTTHDFIEQAKAECSRCIALRTLDQIPEPDCTRIWPAVNKLGRHPLHPALAALTRALLNYGSPRDARCLLLLLEQAARGGVSGDALARAAELRTRAAEAYLGLNYATAKEVAHELGWDSTQVPSDPPGLRRLFLELDAAYLAAAKEAE